MTKVQELQHEIATLSYEQFLELSAWFAEQDWDMWDKKLETDSNSGKLDFLLEEARDSKTSNSLRPL